MQTPVIRINRAQGHIGLAERFIGVFPSVVTEKPE